MSKPMISIVDDDPAVQQSLSWLVESVGLSVQAFSSVQEFIDRAELSKIGCLLLDVRMPGKSGVDLLEELAEQETGIPVIVITGYGEVPTAVRAMKAGAYDFIEKPFNDQMLLDRIHQALELRNEQAAIEAQRKEVTERLSKLTPRESEVLELICQGMSNKQIAAHLGLSEKTVEVHRARVMQKMQADNAAGLVRMVLSAR